jgi:hypothetical protein
VNLASVHCVVIDTNVLAVADGLHDGASDECVLACVRLLQRVRSGQRVAVDTDDLILTEYLGALRGTRESGFAGKLALSLWRRRFDTGTCHRVPITPLAGEGSSRSWFEVPQALRDFDEDDQKFLAVAVAEGNSPPIFEALDLEWWSRRADLAADGLDIQFLCVADIL